MIHEPTPSGSPSFQVESRRPCYILAMHRVPEASDRPDQADQIDPTLPEPVRRFLAAGATLESIALDKEGRFTHQGQPIVHPRLRHLFHRSIDRTPGGTWVLHIPPYTYPITVDDTPYHVRSLSLSPGGPILLRLSDETEEPLDPATLRYVQGSGFYCKVKKGAWEARFNSPAYYQLAEQVEDRAGSYVLSLGPQELPIRMG